jgi:DNA-binding beta-propeller fold protein YncE
VRPLLPLLTLACADPPPATLTLTAWPTDAEVRVGEVVGVGEATAVLPAGSVLVTASRPGFVAREERVDLVAGEALSLEWRLAGEPVAVSVRTEPPGAAILGPDGASLGLTPAELAVPAGEIDWTLRLEGWADERIEAFVDAPLGVERWLDRPGQRLDRLRTFPTCPQPKAVRIQPDRARVWVACLDGPPSVVAHDLADGAVVHSITLGAHGAVELELSADATRLYASQMETHRVFEIDVATGAVLRELDAVGLWSKVVERSADGTRLYVSNWLGDDISELDLATGALLRRLPTVRTPRGLVATPDGRALYAAGFDSGELARVDLDTGASTVVWAEGKNLRHLVLDASRGVLYASDMGLRAVFAHELATGETVKLADASHNTNTIDLTPDGEVLLVSNRGRNGPGGYLTVGPPGEVLVIDARSGALLDRIEAGHQPTGLDVEGDRLVFSDFRDDRLQVWRIPPVAQLRAPDGG